MPTVEVICLANSWKHGGRCVAGLRMDGGGWVRPVSSETEGVLQKWHYTPAGGGEAALLDVLKMPLACPQPKPHHPENWLLAVGQWKRSAQTTPRQVHAILRQSVATGPEVLGCTNEKVPYVGLQQEPILESLALIRPKNLSWQISGMAQGGKRRIRVIFTLAGSPYNLPLTDPVWNKRLANLPEGSHPWEENEREMLLTISLGEPFSGNGFCYKLVAAVIELPKMPAQESIWEQLSSWWQLFWG